MMRGMGFMDNLDTEKTHLRGCVHFVHNVHFVHYLDKPNWLQLPNPGRKYRGSDMQLTARRGAAERSLGHTGGGG
jgi:hypothetical protein